MIRPMDYADACKVLANLDPVCHRELDVFLGQGSKYYERAQQIASTTGVALVAIQGNEPVMIGGFAMGGRPGIASTFLHHVPREHLDADIKREVVRAMRKAIRMIMDPQGKAQIAGIHRVECWSAVGDDERAVKLYTSCGLRLEHKFECYGVNREPVWLYSKVAG